MLPNKTSSNRKEFLEKAQKERELRASSKAGEKAALLIQTNWRRYFCGKQFRVNIRKEFDELICKEEDGLPAITLFLVSRKLLFILQKEDDQRLLSLFRVILNNLEKKNEPKYWFMSVLLFKEWTTAWISILQRLMRICCERLSNIKPYVHSELQEANLYLGMLLVFTDCSSWKILKIKGGENIRPAMQHFCKVNIDSLVNKLFSSLQTFLQNGLSRGNSALNAACLSACCTLANRPLVSSCYKTDVLMMFSSHILSVSGFTLELNNTAKESCKLFLQNGLPFKCLDLLSCKATSERMFEELDPSQVICLLGNLIHLISLFDNEEIMKKHSSSLIDGVTECLRNCLSSIAVKQTSSCVWHPLFGWYKVKKSYSHEINSDAFNRTSTQLKWLWNRQLILALFNKLPQMPTNEETNASSKSGGGIIKRVFRRATSRSSNSSSSTGNDDIKDPLVIEACYVCQLYTLLFRCMPTVKKDIISGLSFCEETIVRLWYLLYSIGPQGGLRTILSYVSGNQKTLPESLRSLLLLLCECTAQLIPLLDDNELYDQQKPFSVDDIVTMTSFLNNLVYKLIWRLYQTDDSKDSNKEGKPKCITQEDSSLLNGSLGLLLILYDRDSRRSYAPTNHWLIKEIKLGQFRCEVESKHRRAMMILYKIPHVIPHHDRVKVFRRWIQADKSSLGYNKEATRASAVVTIHRSRLLEDGYTQLSGLDPRLLKGLVRIKFINEQGLDEPGIDQDGVFKEFLEETIKKAFDPQLNLFMLTASGEQRLYPSPSSYVHGDHLSFFDFIGRMLGKAVYEGMIVDVPFANFFLNQILGRQHSVLHSSIDELPSLDPDLYKNLNFIKNYDGDVSDLEITFSCSDDVLGIIQTYDLKPGGRAIQVTNSNKFSYVHLMAHFRLSVQVKEQTNAFVRGFRSIIRQDWTSMFSAPELQRLISGDNCDLDVDDLKRHISYLGGYHSSHRVILWLWDIIQREFTLQERGLFLKFVTSCSKPPLLGFKYLEPPFCVRLVDCAEDDDAPDTVGSVVRGLLNLRRRNAREVSGRLPTASTCFNLLKLPNYAKKNTLRDKLRYAISSGAGFELS